jgi:hypothetical protein
MVHLKALTKNLAKSRTPNFKHHTREHETQTTSTPNLVPATHARPKKIMRKEQKSKKTSTKTSQKARSTTTDTNLKPRSPTSRQKTLPPKYKQI